jgi:DNA-binding MarR family transcriptional regulator
MPVMSSAALPTSAIPSVASAPELASAPAPTALAGELRVALMRVSRSLRAKRGSADLPEGRFAILTTLHRHGPLTSGALADIERVRPPSVTRAVNALTELGLVEKTDHPTDGRCVVVHLSDAGATEVSETRDRRDAWLTGRLAALTPEERQTLTAACVLLNRIAAD